MGGQRYYTFKKGNARFFSLDSNYMDPVQLAWLEKELKASGSDWKIPFFIIRSMRRACTDRRSTCARVLEPLFVTYGVDVVFAGHEHFYQRVKPQQGITYFVSGRPDNSVAATFGASGFTAVG